MLSKKTLAIILIVSTLGRFARGQTTNASTNPVAKTGVLFMTSHSNLVVISKAVEAASGLRTGMTETEVAKYLERHGMPGMGKLYSASVDHGRTWYTFYPLAGDCSLGFQMRDTNTNARTQVEGPKSKVQSRSSSGDAASAQSRVLERAFIWSQGAEVRGIAFTNAP